MPEPGLHVQSHTLVSRRVLVAPMDWGLGHATRCIPLIHSLLDLNCAVIVAGSGPSLEILKEEFPSLPGIELPPYDPQYARSSALVWKLASQFPRFLNTVRLERYATEKIVRDHNIDFIISDNRYGCRSGKAKSIFMGHQINLRISSGARWMQPAVNHLHQWFLEKFDACWVPDWKGEHSLAGDLSQSEQINALYLGPVSRFSKLPEVPKIYDLAFILSGPEPQRTLLEERIIALAGNQGRRMCIVRGVRDRTVYPASADLVVLDRADSGTLSDIIAKSEVLVARSGYSTIMDLAHTGGKAVFVPTPGQPEQEYLARRLEQNGIAGCLNQDELDLNIVMEKSIRYKGFEGMANGQGKLRNLLREALKI